MTLSDLEITIREMKQRGESKISLPIVVAEKIATDARKYQDLKPLEKQAMQFKALRLETAI